MIFGHFGSHFGVFSLSGVSLGPPGSPRGARKRFGEDFGVILAHFWEPFGGSFRSFFGVVFRFDFRPIFLLILTPPGGHFGGEK